MRITSPRSDRLRVKWEDPDSDSWNGPVVAYKIGWRETAAASRTSAASEGSASYNWTEVERHDASDLQLVLPALRAYTRYELLIQAVNDVGAGPTEMARARTAGDGKRGSSLYRTKVQCELITSKSLIFLTCLPPIFASSSPDSSQGCQVPGPELDQSEGRVESDERIGVEGPLGAIQHLLPEDHVQQAAESVIGDR